MTKAEDRELVLRKDCPKIVESHGEIFYGQTWGESPQDPRHGELGDPEGWAAGRWGSPREEGGTSVMRVRRALPRAQALFAVRESTLGRDPRSVVSVGRPLVGALVFSITEGPTTYRNGPAVRSAGRPSVRVRV